MAKSKKLLFEKYIGAKYDLFMQEKVKGEMLGWAGNYFCGYVVEDCTIIPCIWDVFGRCLFGEQHHEKYDLVNKDGFSFIQRDKMKRLIIKSHEDRIQVMDILKLSNPERYAIDNVDSILNMVTDMAKLEGIELNEVAKFAKSINICNEEVFIKELEKIMRSAV